MGHHYPKQTSFVHRDWQNRDSHGGELRKKSFGRGQRPLSRKDPLHLVFKCHRWVLRERSFRGYRSFGLLQKIIGNYALKFHVKIEQISIQNDHLHLLIRCSTRSQFHDFFRVTAGQIAQVFHREGLLKLVDKMTDTPTGKKTKGTSLWMYRPFTRVVKGWRAYRIVRNYIQLNEKEALGVIKYSKQRLRGLSAGDWVLLWT